MRTLVATLSLTVALAFSALAHASSLKVYVFIHDDVPEAIATSPEDYFDPWLHEMHTIQPYPVEVDYRRNVPGITDLRYQFADRREALLNFRKARSDVDETAFSDPAHDGPRMFLLLTGQRINADTLGAAEIGGFFGIASASTFSAPGHELGHMLTATHEASEILNNPWFCETFMIPARLVLRANCYRYSDQNRAIIGDYIHKLF